MVPGIALSLYWIRHVSGYSMLGMIGYILTCIASMAYHFAFAIHEKNINPEWLRLDMIGQNVGLMLGISQTVMGYTSYLLMAPFVCIPLIADLRNKNEKLVAFACNALNILIIGMFDIKIICAWLTGFMFFYLGHIYMHIWPHVMWHMMCHIAVNGIFKNIWETSLIRNHN